MENHIEQIKINLKKYFEHYRLCLEVDPTSTFEKTDVLNEYPLAYDLCKDSKLEFFIQGTNNALIKSLLEKSNTSVIAWNALKIIENDSNINDKTRYRILKDLPKKPQKRGSNPMKNALRNELIGTAVLQCVMRYELPQYSKGNESKVTACMLIKEVLEDFNIYLTVDAVIKIWNIFKKDNNITT